MERPDYEFFKLSDMSPKTPFLEYLKQENLPIQESELTQVIRISIPVIMEHKRFYNRPRPAQVNSQIKPVYSSTAQTPAFPAGHTCQSYLIATYLSQKYPSHRQEFFRIAKRIADSRVSVGLHYPSDNQAGVKLAKEITDSQSKEILP